MEVAVVHEAMFVGMMEAKMGAGEAIGLVVTAMALLFLYMTIVNSRYAAARAKLARDFGLVADTKDDLRGVFDGFEIAIEVFEIESKKKKKVPERKTRITVGGGLPSDIHLGRSGLMAGLSNRSLVSVEGHDVDIGSTHFDERYVIKGEPLALFALLDAEARGRFAEALDAGWTFQKGVWTFEEFGVLDMEPMAARLNAGLELAGWLKERTCQELVPRVIERVHFDPEPGVRQRALETLVAVGVRRDARVVALLDELRHDEDPKVRLLSARGREDADAMVAMVLNPEIEVQIRREALGELSMLEEARLLVIVPTLLHAPEPVELRSAAVGTLGRLGVEAEGVALDALGDTDVDVRQAAVYALGTIGTARSVPALRALNGPTELERAAKDAVLAIQDRIGVEGGGLALAVDGGGLAVVEAEES